MQAKVLNVQFIWFIVPKSQIAIFIYIKVILPHGSQVTLCCLHLVVSLK